MSRGRACSRSARRQYPAHDWAGSCIRSRFYPPAADIPLDWGDWQFRKNAGGLALSAFLLAMACCAALSGGNTRNGEHVARPAPADTRNRHPAFGPAFLVQTQGKLSTRSWNAVLAAAYILFALWGFGHLCALRGTSGRPARTRSGWARIHPRHGGWLAFVGSGPAPSLAGDLRRGRAVFSASLQALPAQVARLQALWACAFSSTSGRHIPAACVHRRFGAPRDSA